jgi:hypothetical protein
MTNQPGQTIGNDATKLKNLPIDSQTPEFKSDA